MAYAEMAGVGNEEEAAARISAALGLASYPLPVNETLRLCTWLKGRHASTGLLGRVTNILHLTFTRICKPMCSCAYQVVLLIERISPYTAQRFTHGCESLSPGCIELQPYAAKF